MKQTLKKITCGVLATVSLFGCAATLTACETSHPEVEMQIEFNGEAYTLDYKLYRKIAPATVSHFLWLADNGYYDGLCVHDYAEDSRLYTGEYSVTKENPVNLVYKRYYDTIADYDNYNSFPHSVWFDEGKTTPTYTLKGEFEDNNFHVTNGALDETFGSLTMYYHSIADMEKIANTDVYTARASEEGAVSKGDYQFNQTTSAFYVSLSTTSKTNNAYCTFATLDEDGQETLKELQTAISAYIEEHHGEDEDAFTESAEQNVLQDDVLLEGSSVKENFQIPKSPIVIKYVKVTKF